MRPATRHGAAALLLLACGLARAALNLSASVQEPRAYGYQVGDVLERRVDIDVPEGLKLDDASLPRSGQAGKAIELRALERHDATIAGGSRVELRLRYQVFLSPPEVRTLEIAPMTLRFTGSARPQDLRIDAWPVTVAPLVPAQVSPRTGLGELQADAPPPLIDTRPERVRLAVWVVVAGLLLAFLAHVYLALPWFGRRQRPFEVAWRELRAAGSAPAAWPESLGAVHRALNRSAGEVLFEDGLARFVARAPRYAPLRAELQRFFQASREAHFAGGTPDLADRAWLTELCRRCRDAERGAA